MKDVHNSGQTLYVIFYVHANVARVYTIMLYLGAYAAWWRSNQPLPVCGKCRAHVTYGIKITGSSVCVCVSTLSAACVLPA